MSKLTHLDEHGAARMVDVSDKPVTDREASAEALVCMSAEAFKAAIEGTGPKGDVLAAARIAGIMAAKKTSELIPLCHPLAITKASIAFEPNATAHNLRIVATVKTAGQTGVEMEALTAASIAALTVYDMIKAVDKGTIIETIRLLTKSGGKSVDYAVPEAKSARVSAGYRTAPGGKQAPTALMSETSAPPPSRGDARDALRAFMLSRRLQATQWAKEAGVPVSQIYAFLTGKARSLPQETAEKLAHAARVPVSDLFGSPK